jgi:hypothetical protein
MRLLMPFEERQARSHLGPFGEAFAPPGIVLRDSVKLGKIESDQSYRDIGRRCGVKARHISASTE